MLAIKSCFSLLLISLGTIGLCACSNMSAPTNQTNVTQSTHHYGDYASRLPQHLNTGEKTVLVDPNVHAWGAYGADGHLERAGLASAGADYCPDLGHRCHTSTGTFRVASLGGPGCYSTRFPIPHGGAPMPYCMYFNKNQALHGSGELAEGNISHGCVRMHVNDAEWLRYNFVNVGTKVIVKPY